MRPGSSSFARSRATRGTSAWALRGYTPRGARSASRSNVRRGDRGSMRTKYPSLDDLIAWHIRKAYIPEERAAFHEAGHFFAGYPPARMTFPGRGELSSANLATPGQHLAGVAAEIMWARHSGFSYDYPELGPDAVEWMIAEDSPEDLLGAIRAFESMAGPMNKRMRRKFAQAALDGQVRWTADLFEAICGKAHVTLGREPITYPKDDYDE